ncbi:MAG: hypothetical protein GF349_01760 [Candidatus Magasanikbacteria bacterium]|nr:hypothetical protein [Candidatus Magasanikbacteria bacterium]
MKNLATKLIVFLVIVGMTIPGASVFADSSTEFNPNFIISDEEMQDWGTMDRADIQAFLLDHRSYLSNYRTDDWEGTQRLASDIIYQAAREYQINPKYILVKLQKEQSLITNENPTQKALNWATGYGVCDSCSMNDPSIQKFKGFGNQVDYAAGIMRWYYDNYKNEPWIMRSGQSYLIDGELVSPTNLATAFLYTYTPHIHGNQNFWILWQKWFDQIYPDGSLIKSEDSPIVYLLEESKKRPIGSMTALVTRFDPKLIVEVSEDEIRRYETGDKIDFPNYSILKNGSTYYLLDNLTLRPFANYDVIKKLGYHPEEFIEVNKSDIAPFELGKTITADLANPLGKLVKLDETGEMFFLKDGKYHSVIDKAVAKNNFPNMEISSIPAEEMNEFEHGDPLLLKDGTLFGIEGSNRIYVVENGRKRHIASEDVYNGLGYKWENIVWVNQFAGMAHENGQSVYLRSDLNDNIDQTQTVAGQSSIIDEKQSFDPDLLMQKTPEEDTQYIGEKFDTASDVYLVADYDSGEILMGKNVDVVRPIASFTKVMTAYRLLKEGLRTSAGVTTYNPEEHNASYHTFRVTVGEKIKNIHLMYAMLISSLNTPSRMLVDSVEPNESDFVRRMNEQAKEWGLDNTKFADTSGIYTENKSTAREYFALFTRAIDNVTLKNILAMKGYEYDEVLDLDDKPHHYDYHSNDLVNEEGLKYNIIASKTGYLYESGAGLIMLIERPEDGKKFVIINMGMPKDDRFAEPNRLAELVVEQF